MKHKAGDIIKCKRKGCLGTFVFNPKWKFQKYCSQNCSEIMNRERQRRRAEKLKIGIFGNDKWGRSWSNLLTDRESYSGIRRFHDDNEFPLYDQVCTMVSQRSKRNAA